uniref:Glycine rich superfamily member n=1 Tax=Globodera pallida TaxID=36090 RepID=A0A183BQS1_GLOPA
MKGRWRPANSEHAEQVVGRDGGRRKKSDERHWGASARGPAERARARSPGGYTRGLLPEPGVSPHLLAAVVECAKSGGGHGGGGRGSSAARGSSGSRGSTSIGHSIGTGPGHFGSGTGLGSASRAESFKSSFVSSLAANTYYHNQPFYYYGNHYYLDGHGASKVNAGENSM